MCDKCGNIFSEKAEGWQTFSVSRQTTNPHGIPVSVTDEYDACPQCSFTPSVQPVIQEIESDGAA